MLAYSARGLTRVKYALSLIEVAPIFRFRLKKPIVRFAHICPKSTTVFPRVYILLPRVTQVTRGD